MKFPLTLNAIKNAESDNWAIGDALLAECGPPGKTGHNDGAHARLVEAATYVLGEGFKYSAAYLSSLRVTAHAFEKSKRIPSIAWGTHHQAGSPEYLQAIIAGAPKGVKVTQPYIEAARKTQREKAKKERELLATQAREAREKAEAELEEARRLKDKEAIEKKAANLKEAKANQKAHRELPKRARTEPPKPESVPLLVAEAGFMANAASSVALAQKATKDLRGSLDQLDEVSIRALTEVALEAVNAWNEAARIVRSETSEQRGHLSVVGE